MRTLTRKSIKPTRLFESEEDKAARERARQEEEATDVEARTSEDEFPRTNGSSKSLKTPTQSADKKVSPFDKWPRLKKGSREGSTSKALKRTASDALDGSSIEDTGDVSRSSKRKTRA
jgi:hypothetical protein